MNNIPNKITLKARPIQRKLSKPESVVHFQSMLPIVSFKKEQRQKQQKFETEEEIETERQSDAHNSYSYRPGSNLLSTKTSSISLLKTGFAHKSKKNTLNGKTIQQQLPEVPKSKLQFFKCAEVTILPQFQHNQAQSSGRELNQSCLSRKSSKLNLISKDFMFESQQERKKHKIFSSKSKQSLYKQTILKQVRQLQRTNLGTELNKKKIQKGRNEFHIILDDSELTQCCT